MKVQNPKAFYDYQILETFEAGLRLTGAEVKAVRLGQADLKGSYARLIGDEAFLVNAKILPYQFARPDNYEPARTRKLLLHRSELQNLRLKMDGQNLTLVPLSLYTTSHYIKLQLGLGKGKKQFQKREAIKRADLDREMEQEFRGKK